MPPPTASPAITAIRVRQHNAYTAPAFMELRRLHWSNSKNGNGRNSGVQTASNKRIPRCLECLLPGFVWTRYGHVTERHERLLTRVKLGNLKAACRERLDWTRCTGAGQ